MGVEDVRRELEMRAFYYARFGDVTDDDLAGFARGFGAIAVEPRDARTVRPVSPSGEADARRNTLSSRYGFGAFPFHTDTAYWREPASILVLYCVEPGRGCRQTLVSDVRSWSLSDGDTGTLTSGVWRVQRQREAFLVRLARRSDTGLRVRYDSHCMAPLGAEGFEAAQLVAERTASHHVAITWSAGALLIIDNRRAIHARTAAICPDPERTLKRILVRTDG